jgi:DNA primase
MAHLLVEVRAMIERIEQLTKNLWDSMEAMDYLRGRGFSSATIAAYDLGYETSGYFANSIAIPYKSGLGQWTGIKYRRLDPGDRPKYDKERGQPNLIFNMGDLRHPEVWVTEGEFNAMTLIEHGCHAVAIGGAENMKEHWRHLFYGTKLFLAFDGDATGRQASIKWARFLRQGKPRIEYVVVDLPDNEDINSLYLNDTEGFGSWLKSWSG